MKTLKGIKQLVLGTCMVLSASMAQSAVVDFIDLTQSPTSGLGESAWGTLHLDINGIGLDITGHATNDTPNGNNQVDNEQFAYLDWGRAGLGVCKDAVGANVAHKGSGTNRCSPASDDNVTVGEYLSFVFDADVVIQNFWFNNNHDGGFGNGDKVTIDGQQFNVTRGYAGGANGIGSFTVAANTALNVAYNNEEFYVSGMQVSAVPEPASIALIGVGLLGLGFARKRAK